MKIIVVGVNNCWGRADNLTQALKNSSNPKHYAAFLCSDETKVSGIDGGLEYPLAHGAPILLDRKLPKSAKPNKEREELQPAAAEDESIIIGFVDKTEAAIEKWQNGKLKGSILEVVDDALGNARLELSRMLRQKESV